uniref:Sperm-activating peptide SAP-b n=1 Tax=Clypeaster japonicus TaxID=7644 RepID=MOSH_CLYJA|nr:RecName: Full=Sperm-activating peptide SAP-b; AltName: Full=[His6]-mosact [Clypeaster japonicus]prf//1708180A sperm activating peptide III [Clypeaster japonicus]prf//1708180J sperm activating peptide III [Astriclypeus mannii]
DSDSAHLIG